MATHMPPDSPRWRKDVWNHSVSAVGWTHCQLGLLREGHSLLPILHRKVVSSTSRKKMLYSSLIKISMSLFSLFTKCGLGTSNAFI